MTTRSELLRKISQTVAACLLAAMAAGCQREEVKSYSVPKEADPHAGHAHGPGEGMPAGHPEMNRARPKLTWTLPEGWTDTGAKSMNLATFAIKGKDDQLAQVAITPLANMEGKESIIVNMWREQVGQAALPEQDALKELAPVEIAGAAGKMFDIAGKSDTGKPMRIVTAMAHVRGQSWFYKLQGDDEWVVAQKPAFVNFLKTVKIEEAPAGLPDGHPPVNSGVAASGPPPAPVPPREGGPKWTVPAGWTEVAGGQFLFAKFTIAGAGGQAAVNVSTSSGDGGGLLANLNRWRGQLGQSPWTDADVAKNVSEMETAGGKAQFVSMSGTDARTGQPAALVGAMTMNGGSAWFYKLMGDARVVEAQKEAFTKFVKEVKY